MSDDVKIHKDKLPSTSDTMFAVTNDEKIARWWDRVRGEICWVGEIEGVAWKTLVRDYPEEFIESVRNVYRAARRTP